MLINYLGVAIIFTHLNTFAVNWTRRNSYSVGLLVSVRVFLWTDVFIRNWWRKVYSNEKLLKTVTKMCENATKHGILPTNIYKVHLLSLICKICILISIFFSALRVFVISLFWVVPIVLNKSVKKPLSGTTILLDKIVSFAWLQTSSVYVK